MNCDFHFAFFILHSFMPYPRFHPFVRLILCAIAVLVSVFAVSAIVLVLMGAGSQIISTTNSSTTPFQLSPRLMLALMAAQVPTMILAVLLCRTILDTRSLSSLGVRGRDVPQFFNGSFCGFLAIAFLFGLLWISGHIQVHGVSERALAVGTGGILLRLLLWAVVMLGVGLSEEILFRGYALHNLGVWLGADKVGLGAAAIIQALLFGLVHMGNFGAEATPEKISAAWQALPNIVLIGIFFALCAFKTGSLWFPIGFHAAWNFFLGSVFSLPVSGLKPFHLLETEVSSSRWLTGGAFGAEGSVLLTVIILVLLYMVRQAPDHPQVIADIAALRPQEEQDEIEVASRAPGLRERKEKRREQTVTGSTFEGWNDLAPAQRQKYSTYQPPQPALENTASTEIVTPDASPQNTFAINTFAINAPIENSPGESSPVVATPIAPVAPNFEKIVPPLTPLSSEWQPERRADKTDDRSVAPTESSEVAPDREEATPTIAPEPVPTPAPTPPPTPPAPSPAAPPAPTVKKPPAPRW